jgi:antitoxin MazE
MRAFKFQLCQHEASMKTRIRRMGNSQGVLIPKPLLAQAGLEGEVEMTLEEGAIVLRKPVASPREGWAEASRKLAEAGDDALVWPEFANDDDASLKW